MINESRYHIVFERVFLLRLDTQIAKDNKIPAALDEKSKKIRFQYSNISIPCIALQRPAPICIANTRALSSLIHLFLLINT